MVTASNSFSAYVQKLKHLGIKWGLGRFFNHLLEKVFRIKSQGLIIYYLDVMEMPPFPADVDIDYRNVREDEVDKIVSMKIGGLGRKRIEEFFKRGSECMGAFVGEQLVGCIWAHHKIFDWPFFGHTLELKEGEGYIGNDYVIPEFRGKKIHLGLLSRAMRVAYFRNSKRGYGSAYADNLASIKGIKQFGGKPMLYLRTTKLHKLTIYSKKIDIQEA